MARRVRRTEPIAARDYFELAHKAWVRAEDAAGDCVERWYEIAGLAVRLQFAGPALLPAITPALAHLARPSENVRAVLTVRLWDCTSTRTEMPESPVAIEGFTIRGELTGFNDGRHHAAYDGLGRTLVLYDKVEQAAWVCIHEASLIPTYERAAPLRSLFGWLMRDHGRQMVHAAGIGNDWGGVLVVGRGGAGKSNTSVGSMLAGFAFAGDDFCAVSANPTPIVYSLYSSAKLRTGDWATIPLPRANPDDPESEKNLYYLHPHFAGQIKSAIPIHAVLLPTRGGRDRPSFERISPRLPLIEMVSQSISLLPNAGAEVVSMLAPLVRQLPCYRFYLGARPRLVPDAISALLQSLRSTSTPTDHFYA